MSAAVPEVWRRVALGDVVDARYGRGFAMKDLTPEGYPVFGANGQVGFYSEYTHEHPEVLLTCRGATCGTVNVSLPKSFVTSNSFVVTPRSADVLDKEFLRYALESADRSKFITGTAQPQVTLANFNPYEILLPPIADQRRIVSRITALRAMSSRARSSLNAVPQLLEKLRQSILASAFRGDLTKDWRAKNKNVEPASVLLDRIRAERRKKWEQSELAKMKSRGTPRTGDRWRARYPQPTPAPTEGLAELPPGWCWASVGELLADGLANGRSVPTDDGGFPVLRLTALRNGQIDIKERKGGAWSAADAAPFLVQKDDFLVSRGNGSLNLVGRGGLVQEIPDAVAFPDTLIRIRAHSLVDRRYLAMVWTSRIIRRQIEAAAKTTAGIFKVSQADLETIAVPIPEVGEQRVITQLLQSRLTVVHSLEQTLDAGRKFALHLDRAVLGKAFAGCPS